MDITPLIDADKQIINGYGEGYCVVSQQKYEHPVIVFPQHTLDWQPKDVNELCAEDFKAVIQQKEQVELLLIGLGKSHRPPSPSLRQAMQSHGIQIDIMTADAACRTYNVLLAEGRKLAVAVYPKF